MLPAISVLSGILESLFLTYWASHIPVLHPKSPSLSTFSSPSLPSDLGESHKDLWTGSIANLCWPRSCFSMKKKKIHLLLTLDGIPLEVVPDFPIPYTSSQFPSSR